MSRSGKKAALVLTLVLAATATMVVSAGAQVGPVNIGGGTNMRQSVEEGRGSFSSAGLVSRQLTLPAAWLGILGSFAPSRYATAVAPRKADGRSLKSARRTIAR